MLLSFFKSYGSVGAVLRNFRLNSYLSSARGVTTKKRNVFFSDGPEIFHEKPKEQTVNIKNIPSDYKLIYRSQDLQVVSLTRMSVFLFTGAAIWIGYQLYFNPKFFNSRVTIFRNEEILIFLFLDVIVAYLFTTRHVYYIFRNGKSYKTVRCGFFGKSQPRIIDHQAGDLIQPNPKSIFPFFHKLKGQYLIISKDNFFHEVEYLDLSVPYQSKK